MRRCEACGASNPDTAAWCGQCYAGTAQATDEPPVERAAPGASPTRPAAGGLRRDGARLEWRCPVCRTDNPVASARCRACATPMTTAFGRDPARPAPAVGSRALLVSVLAPGAGHILGGRVGTGAARLLLFAVWALGAGLLLAAGGPAGAPVGAPLLLGAAALWSVTLVDVRRMSAGEPDLLNARVLLWLVVAVLGLAMAGAAASVAALRR